jgi:hypothetical protein
LIDAQAAFAADVAKNDQQNPKNDAQKYTREQANS